MRGGKSMSGVRSVILVVVLFAGGFFGVSWIRAGAPIWIWRVVSLKADSRVPTFLERSEKDIAAEREQRRLESKTVQSDGDAERDGLRNAVIDTANAFTLSPCNDVLQRQYFEAAAAYARAFMTLAGCPKYPICTPDDAKRENAEQVFRSPADGRAKQAIRAVHNMGITQRDYPGGIGPVLAKLSDSGHASFNAFSCMSQEASAASRADNNRAPPPIPERTASEQRTRASLDRDSREHYRDAVLKELRQPGPAWCSDPRRSHLVGSVNQYYTLRYGQQFGPGIRSPEYQAEVERAWSTALDEQIDNLVREFYVQGYLRRGDVHKSSLTDKILAGLAATGHACPKG
jgi:hypothetical protein